MLWLLLLSAAIVVADQYTKHLAYLHLANQPPIEITGFLNFALAFNTGAAFSLLEGAGGWQTILFVAAAGVVSALILFWLVTGAYESWVAGLGLSLLLGGAIGNLIDRITAGYVIDFIDVHYSGLHFPTFNIADIAISVGVTLVIMDLLGLVPGKKALD